MTDTLPENTGWSGSYGQAILNEYGNNDGTLDTNALSQDWSDAGGKVYNYVGNDAQNAFSDIQAAAASGNVGDFMNNAGNYNTTTEDWSWTGFDVFSIGGNSNNGGIVYNEYGQIDYKNSWFSIGSSSGQNFENPESSLRGSKPNIITNAQVMLQAQDE